MITFLQVFKYLTASLVALSVAASGLAALFFLAFCDHGPFLWCLSYAAIAPGIALVEVALQTKAWALLKQRHRLGLSMALMLLSIAPTLLGVMFFRRTLG
jgi:hypothetical protein